MQSRNITRKKSEEITWMPEIKNIIKETFRSLRFIKVEKQLKKTLTC